MEFRPTTKRILLNTIFGLILIILFGTIIVSELIKHSFWAAGIIALFSALFTVPPVGLHFNYWIFDKDTEFWIFEDSFKLKNRTTNKEINGRISEIEKIFRIETQNSRAPWLHEYTVIKMNDGKTFTISNYVIDPGEIIEFFRLKRTVTTKEVFIPTIEALTLDKELRKL